MTGAKSRAKSSAKAFYAGAKSRAKKAAKGPDMGVLKLQKVYGELLKNPANFTNFTDMLDTQVDVPGYCIPILSPNDRLVAKWQILLLVMIILVAFLVPYDIAFLKPGYVTEAGPYYTNTTIPKHEP